MKRVLVLQMCRFGDILQTTPMLRGIRRHLHQTDVTLVVNDAFSHVPIPSSLYDSLRFLPYTEIAEMLATDRDAWPAAVARLETFVESLGAEPFDLTLNLTHSELASLLAAVVPSRDVRGGLMATGSDPDRSGRGDDLFLGEPALASSRLLQSRRPAQLGGRCALRGVWPRSRDS